MKRHTKTLARGERYNEPDYPAAIVKALRKACPTRDHWRVVLGYTNHVETRDYWTAKGAETHIAEKLFNRSWYGLRVIVAQYPNETRCHGDSAVLDAITRLLEVADE